MKRSETEGGLTFKEIQLEMGEIDYRGRSLKELRERLGIDLKAISMETKINLKILEAIEAEDVARLPAPVYLKGFLKAYARVLHLDAQKLIEGYFQLFKGEREK